MQTLSESLCREAAMDAIPRRSVPDLVPDLLDLPARGCHIVNKRGQMAETMSVRKPIPGNEVPHSSARWKPSQKLFDVPEFRSLSAASIKKFFPSIRTSLDSSCPPEVAAQLAKELSLRPNADGEERLSEALRALPEVV